MSGEMFADEAHLSRRRTCTIDDQGGFYELLGLQPCNDIAPRIVIPDQPDKDAARAERSDVARHVAGPADRDFVALDRQHRCRRLGRNTTDLAIDEVVEHQITDAEDGLLADALETFLEIQHSAIPVLAVEKLGDI